MIDRKQIKAAARAQMAQAAPRYWKVMLVWVLAAVLLPQLALSLTDGSITDSIQELSQLLAGGIDLDLALRALEMSMGQLVSTWLLNVVLSLYQIVLGFGVTFYCLRLCRGQPCGVADLFTGFSMVGRVVGQWLLIEIIVIGCVILTAIPATIAGIYAAAVNEIVGGILLIVVAVAALLLIVALMLNYALASITLADRPELGAMGAIQYGKNLIRGNKGQFVVFCLSFFGWALLCSLPNGIFSALYSVLELPITLRLVNFISAALMLPYYLWLTPYMQTASAGFYDALRQEKQDFFPQMPPV